MSTLEAAVSEFETVAGPPPPQKSGPPPGVGRLNRAIADAKAHPGVWKRLGYSTDSGASSAVRRFKADGLNAVQRLISGRYWVYFCFTTEECPCNS